MPATESALHLLVESVWKKQLREHEERFNDLVAPHVERRSRHEKDPVADFMFEYYAFRPSHLAKWSPGLGCILENGKELFEGRDHFRSSAGDVMLGVDRVSDSFWTGTKWILSLLHSTQNRPAQFGCFGLHEWAMLYEADEKRHNQLPLRLPQERVNQVVQEGPVNCSHFDAFRFFTPTAKPLNRQELTRENMASCEQPGCLHTNMDVYRWAFKRYPWISSTLILDCFELALEIRSMDMAASPYDLLHTGLKPVRIETAAGRLEYGKRQKDFSFRAAILRAQLIDQYERIMSYAPVSHDSFANPPLDS